MLTEQVITPIEAVLRDNDNTICEMIRSHFGPDGFVVDSCSELDDLYSIEAGAGMVRRCYEQN